MKTLIEILICCLGTAFYILTGMWLMMKYCFWVNCGWCHDWTPIYMYFFGIIIGFIGSFYLYRVVLKKHSLSFNSIIKGFLPLVIFISAALYFKNSEIARSKVMRPVKYGKLEALNAALNEGLSPDACDTFCRESALMYAVSVKNVGKIKALINAGADLNFRHKRNKQSVLELAQKLGDQEIINLLVESGAK